MKDSTTITVGIFVEGGIVQFVKASAPVEVFVVDSDILESVAFDGNGGLHVTGDVCGQTDYEEQVRREYADYLEKLERYDALPTVIY